MIKNYFKTALRNFVRNKTFSFIKIAGLSIGLTVCMLIALYTKDEMSYDRFHENEGRLFRIVQGMQMGDDERKLGVTTPHLGPAFEKEIPEINSYVRTNVTSVTVKNNNEVFTENPLIVDSTFFSLFTFPLLKGNPNTALNDIHSLVLSEDLAKKYFGSSDVIGKTMEVRINNEFEIFSISAVAKNSPENSTIRFGMLLPFNYFLKNNELDDDWIGGNVNTFLLLDPKADPKIAAKKMQAIYDQHTSTQIEAVKKKRNLTLKVSLALEPISDLHLGAFGQDNGLETGGSITYSYILTTIAIFILIVACINFINLAIAQSLKRSKEIGIRKVAGSTRRQLIAQFLVESFIISSISFVIAVLLASMILPLFNEMANKNLSLAYLADYKLFIGYFLLLLITSFVAGFYPSLVLSSFKPVKVLYNRQKLMGRNYFTRGLVVLQFTLTLFLIISTVAIYTQLNFIYKKDLGYDTENLVRIDMPPAKNNNKPFQIFQQELANNPSVISIAGRNRGVNITNVKASGKEITIDYSKINEDFFTVLKIPLKEGRNFNRNFPSDGTQAAIVNESFVKEAGWKNPIGQTFSFQQGNKSLTVIGVIKDYHFRSLKVKISPQIFAMDTSGKYGQAWVKLSPVNTPATITSLQQSFKKISPFSPFSYQFMKDVTLKEYETEARWKQIIGVSSILFIFISCIGLLGLVILSIEQRIKEIGIRKILGAAASRIVILISRDFLLLIGIAFLIAMPAGYYAIDQWLQNFAYRMDISWWIFALSGISISVIVLATLGIQAVKAAVSNPVKSLRTE